MKYRLTVYVNKTVVELAKASQLNLSSICEKALEEATGFQDPLTLAEKILHHKAQIMLLSDVMEGLDDVQDRFTEMLAMYENRHPKGMKTGPTKDQDMTWIRAVKGRYGLQGMRDKELYEKLKEGMA